ncbi:MAG: hypothetical protein IPJ41_17160 [Phycisphaerales bacterium]|nr:hypothetical protein [Phycisphaerales bacterium]
MPDPTGWTVRQISAGDDALIEAARAVWRRAGIPEAELDPVVDVREWMNEHRLRMQEAARSGKAERFREYFLVSTRGEMVGAALWATYYTGPRLLFVSYLGQDVTKLGSAGRPVEAIYRRLRRDLEGGELSGVVGIAFEIDTPTTPRAAARRRLFFRECRRHGLTVGTLAVPYVQPPLELEGRSDAVPMSLCFIPRPCPPEWASRGRLPIDAARNVLDFVFDDVYGDAYNDQPDLHDWTPEQTARHTAHLRETKMRVCPTAYARTSENPVIDRLSNEESIGWELGPA